MLTTLPIIALVVVIAIASASSAQSDDECSIADVFQAAETSLNGEQKEILRNELMEQCWELLKEALNDEDRYQKLREAYEEGGEVKEAIKMAYRQFEHERSGIDGMVFETKDACFEFWNIPMFDLPIADEKPLMAILQKLNVTEYPLAQYKEDHDWDLFKREAFFQMVIQVQPMECRNRYFRTKCEQLFGKSAIPEVVRNESLHGMASAVKYLCEANEKLELKWKKQNEQKNGEKWRAEIGKAFRWMTKPLRLGATWLLENEKLFDLAWFTARSYQFLSNDFRVVSPWYYVPAINKFREICSSAERYVLRLHSSQKLSRKDKFEKVLEKLENGHLAVFGISESEAIRMAHMCRRVEEVRRWNMYQDDEETARINNDLMEIFDGVFGDEETVWAAETKWASDGQCVAPDVHQQLVYTFDQTNNNNVQGIEPLCHLAIEVKCRTMHGMIKTIGRRHDSKETMLRNLGIRVTRPAFFMDMKEEFCNENNHNFEKSLLIQPPFMKDDSNCSLPDSVNYSMNDLGFNTQNDEISQRYDAIAKVNQLLNPFCLSKSCIEAVLLAAHFICSYNLTVKLS
ncbi:unnamed protein product [Caenorhabditis bovis]|uniref:Uncharacterized protein n=1 Tax=Caenorhabditis bovis TaxID=2654633 RepID=A0A8S1E596_9PELO|nr:unnamed protein product [Caenorhabditis bovis]